MRYPINLIWVHVNILIEASQVMQLNSLKTSLTVLHWKTYQNSHPCSQLSVCPLSASPCWCHTPQHWILGARYRPLWSSWWICPATMGSAWTALPAASVGLAENECNPGIEKQCHLQGRRIMNKTIVWNPGGGVLHRFSHDALYLFHLPHPGVVHQAEGA